jgi:hypothetical protein
MGEIAEMMLDGFMCEQCGEIIGDIETGEGQGFPGLCAGCQAEQIGRVSKPKDKRFKCTDCNRRFSSEAARCDHIRDKHQAAKEAK